MADLNSIGTGGIGPRTTTRRGDASRVPGGDRTQFYPPPPALRNFIPEDDVIDSLVGRARAALAKGIYWDRGSIINLVL